MSSCNGCQHYQPAYEACAKLLGVLYCPDCDRQWEIAKSISCPRCAEFKGMVDASECPGGKPSVLCQGFEARQPEVVQGELF